MALTATDEIDIEAPGADEAALIAALRALVTTFTYAELLDGTASNLLLRNPSAGGTRVHIEPKGNVSGLASKLDLMLDPFADDTTNYRLFNVYGRTYSGSDAQTTQGDNGVISLNAKAVGDAFGINPSIHIGFGDQTSATSVVQKFFYFDTSDTTWRTPMKGFWRTGIAVTSGDYFLAGSKLYQSGTTGTTGATEPSHSSGTVSDGTVDWAFVRDFSASSASVRAVTLFGDRDDMPKFGLPGVKVQFADDAAFWNGEKLQFLDSSSAVAWSIYTNGSTDDLFIESADGASRLRLDSTGKFLQVSALSVAFPRVAATDADTTPSVKGISTLSFANTGATSVTQFDDGIPDQRLRLVATNGNTTLVHGTNIKLIGNANRVLTANANILGDFNSAGTVWIEQGYNA